MRQPRPPTCDRWNGSASWGLRRSRAPDVATALALILYILLRPVSRDLAFCAVFFNIVSIAIEGVAAVSLMAALFPLLSAHT